MVWYSHLFKNFPQFVVIHVVKGFGIVNKAEVDVFLELSCFFHDAADVGNLISGSSAFSKTSLNICKFTVHVLLQTQPGSNSVALITHYVPDMVSLLEKISMITDTWYVATDFVNASFALPVKKVDGKLFAFTSHGKRQKFKVATGSQVLKEIYAESSLEGLMLKLKLQYFGHLMEELTH